MIDMVAQQVYKKKKKKHEAWHCCQQCTEAGGLPGLHSKSLSQKQTEKQLAQDREVGGRENSPAFRSGLTIRPQDGNF